MKTLSLICACLALSAPVLANAQETAVSDASIRQLLEVTESRKMLDGIMNQVDSMMQTGIKEALAGKNVTAEQQAILDDMRTEMVNLMREQLSWSAFEPMMIEIYRKTFTESEVQGMLDFYRTPTGRAVIAKMPLVTQESLRSIMVWMGPFQQKIRALQEKTMTRLRETQAQ